MKKINIYDMQKNYYIDEVTCFEHPVAVALNYYDERYCSLYISLSKIYGIYCGGIDNTVREDVRERVFEDLKNIVKVNKVEYSKISWDIIKENIDSGKPLIAGVNLKSIFYSEHYLKEDWGHWMLINGYDEDSKTLSIVDNTQFGHLGEKYDEFIITYEMLQRASKDYKRQFDNKIFCFTLEKESGFNYKESLIKVLNKYVDMNEGDWESYRQIGLLKVLNEMSNGRKIYSQYYYEEFKKKIININKYRQVFFDEISYTMSDFQYDNFKIENYKDKLRYLNEKWDKFILLNVIKAVKGRFDAKKISSSIVELEKDLVNEVKEYIEYLEMNIKGECNDEITEIHKKEITYEIINDKDNIVYGNDNEIVFSFTGKRIYNWWIEDDAPKVNLYRGNICTENRGIRIVTNIEIDRDIKSSYEELVQAGIYVRTCEDNKFYVCGFEGKERWILDRIGYDGQHKAVKSTYSIYIEIKKSKLTFGFEEEDRKKSILFEQDICTDGEIVVGLVCKTWQKPVKAKVYFRNTEIEMQI